MSNPAKRPYQGGYENSRKKAEKEAYLSSPTYYFFICNDRSFLKGETAFEDHWSRPDAPQIDPHQTNLLFQWLDVSMYDGEPLKSNPAVGQPVPGSKQFPVPIIKLFGVTKTGNSVLAHIHGVTPYFYVNAPPNWNPAVNEPVFLQRLNQIVSQTAKTSSQLVVGVETIIAQSIMGYHFKEQSKFIKIYVSLPTHVPKIRTILKDGIFIQGIGNFAFQCYEANMPFILRFMVDNNIGGGYWLELPKNTYSMRESNQKTSTCQYECDVVFNSLISHEPQGEYSHIAPFRVLSYDIECYAEKGTFCTPEKDAVIQIANIISEYGKEEAVIKNVFVLHSCKPIAGAQVIECETEKELLLKWRDFIVASDPDLITGYNIDNFDFPYLLNRAKTLKVNGFTRFCRSINIDAKMKATTFSSSAYGKSENMEITIDGRVVFDMIQYMRRNHKLSSYSLNSVSSIFLGQQKEDVDHNIISVLHDGTDEDRRRLAVYCLKDAYLPQQLMDKLLVLVNYIEMARVTGVPLSFLLSRGQQIKVVSMLYRKAREEGLLIPTLERGSGGDADESTYEGATVISPKTGFYNEPICTLDFASLYPSIMRAHNICYSTLIKPSDLSKLQPDDYIKTPSNTYFIKSKVHQGILPQILKSLLDQRAVAKKDMKAAKDPLTKAVQNGRQLALKVSANSVYGFTGATNGFLPCLEISEAVTSFGRQMIDATANYVIQHYPGSNVIYGDTDSVMIKFGVKTVKEAIDLGYEAAPEVSKLFPSPVKLEFEKVYFPYLLMNKKRYAGLWWTNPDKWDKLDAKGIESVRRDNCLLVRNLVSTCLNKILIDRDVDAAIQYVKNTISDLLQNKLDISLLVITKALGKSASSDGYAAKQAHVELAERMRKRDPASAPQVGDRVPYVIIEAVKGAPAYEKSEDPIYVLDHNLPIDANYYLENQLKKPIQRLFSPIISNPDTLLKGDHTRMVIRSTPSSNSGIMAFAVKTLKCLYCKSPLKPNETGPVCHSCQDKIPEVYMGVIAQKSELEKRYCELWSTCQKCQGSLTQNILCTSRDCPLFYQRRKVEKDLEQVKETYSRFKTV